MTPPDARPDPAVRILVRSMSRGFLSNAYLVADGPGGRAALVDTGAPAEPLLRAIEENDLELTHIFCTHRHGDHVSGNRMFRERFGAAVCAHRAEAAAMGGVDVELEDGSEIETGGLEFRVLHLPGHTVGQVGYVVNDERVFTGDTLFRGSVGGTRAPGHATFEDLHRSIMDRLMQLPHGLDVHPGHTESTTVGEEWRSNPFIRMWRGIDRPGEGRCTAFGEPARLLLRSADYDGGWKCWVRFDDGGKDDIVPGSAVTPW